VRPDRASPGGGRLGLALALWAGLGPGCAPLFPPTPAPAVAEGSRPALAEDVAHEPVSRALDLADAGRPEAALALLDAALKAGTAPEEETLYWIGMLRLAEPVGDRVGGREALTRLADRYPEGTRGRAAAALLTLLDEVDRLAADNAALHRDLKQLLDIDVEAQRKRREGAATP
jgi:hypothetical protein